MGWGPVGQPGDQRVGVSVLCPLWPWGEGLEVDQSPAANDSINSADVMKPPKLQKDGSESFRAGEHTEICGEWHAWGGHGSPAGFPQALS